jgi:hypothetical protein
MAAWPVSFEWLVMMSGVVAVGGPAGKPLPDAGDEVTTDAPATGSFPRRAAPAPTPMLRLTKRRREIESDIEASC